MVMSSNGSEDSDYMDFPLIYCNGDSYADEDFDPCMHGNTFADYLGSALGGFVINNATLGSCNRRIIRSACHDLLLQRELNPTQKIIALIEFGFEIRDEIWIGDLEQDRDPQESHFRTHQFSAELQWRQHLLEDRLIVKGEEDSTVDQVMLRSGNDRYPVNKKFLRRWSEGRAYFYSPYAERINFLMDILLFKKLLEQNNIQYLMFQGSIAEKLDKEYLLDFFRTHVQDQRIFDLETFSFCGWCHKHGYQPFPGEPYEAGHYGPDAHKAFAEQFLLPALIETNQL
jgi:hypothetical protein